MIHASWCSREWSKCCAITTARAGCRTAVGALPSIEELNELSWTCASRAGNGRWTMDGARNLATASSLAENRDSAEWGRRRLAGISAAAVGSQGSAHHIDGRWNVCLYR